MPPPPTDDAVFLNIPYDEEFRSLYIAYIVGLYQLGLIPHIASEISGGTRRLDRVLALIQSCRYSIHDLSRVELTAGPPATPRFNMPLELGMTISWQILNPGLHTWFLFESDPSRFEKSASDLKGTDANIHFGTTKGVLSELRNVFWRDAAPSVAEILEVYRFVETNVDAILKRNGTSNLFAAGVFKELCRLCATMSSSLRGPEN
jgi:hypothetical protein